MARSVLAWIAYTHLGLKKGRSMAISILIGAASALLGGIAVERGAGSFELNSNMTAFGP